MKTVITATFILLSLNLNAQQDDYIEAFLLAYGKLQKATTAYLSHSSNNKIDSSCISLELITQQYRTLLKIYDEAVFKYRHDPAFETLSHPSYMAVFEETERLFVNDALLAQMEAMVQVMVAVEREGFPRNDKEVKRAIEALYFQDYYNLDFQNNTLEGNILRKQLQGMKAYIDRKYR